VSQPSSSEQQPLGPGAPRYRKPRLDLYTILLTIALLALILGAVLLYAHLDTFGNQISGGPIPTARLWFDAIEGGLRGLCQVA